jgi:aquaporin Z
MVSAGAFSILLAPYPRELMGLAMGLTAVAIIKSPLGKRSGAHMNPAVTLTFHRLGKIDGRDAVGYVVAQFAGGAAGLALLAFVARRRLAAVSYAATTPGTRGVAVAFVAELAISFLLMTVVLYVSNAPRFARFTPFVAGACVMLFITFEAPLSGMSMNPARTLASALAGGPWDAIWIYFVAPPLGMLAAATFYRGRVYCAKLDHFTSARCIFRCAFGEMRR